MFEGEDESGEVTSVSFIKGEMHFLINSIRKDSERMIRRQIFVIGFGGVVSKNLF